MNLKGKPNPKDVNPYDSKALKRSRGRFLGKGRSFYGLQLTAALLKRKHIMKK